jgi:cytochrome P450
VVTQQDSIAAEKVLVELFNTPEGRSDPYPRYHELRQLDPVHYSPEFDAWFITRYQDCSAVLRDPRFGKDYAHQTEIRFGQNWREHPSLMRGEKSMVNLDGPEHARLRRLVIKAFTRRTIDRMRPTIETIMDRLLDPFEEAGGGDLMADVAFPMPVTVIGELLGVPEADRAQFRSWVNDLVATLEMQVSDEDLLRADAATLSIRRYFDALIEEKRRRPDDALLSRLVHIEDAGDKLNSDELAEMCLLIFAAGFETTTNLLGNGVVGLLKQPEQMQLLRERPELIPLLPDELLRYDGTAQLAVRDTTAEVEVGGVLIPPHQSIFAMLGAANHDPDEFENPDRIDVTRERFRPMSFGGGVHFCLGASLAKAEIEIGFRSLLERFDRLEFVGGPPEFRDRLTLRGVQSLPMRVERAPVRRNLNVEPEPPDHEPTERIVIPVIGAPQPPRAVRPAPGSEGDGRWRAAQRGRIERGEAPTMTGTALAATIVLLARSGLFRRCNAQEIARLAETAYPITFEAGEALCVEGSESLECYAIEEGEAHVTIGGAAIRRVGETDIVGERGVLEGVGRSATVTAVGHMLTYAISRQRLLELVASSPQAREGMFTYMKARYRD